MFKRLVNYFASQLNNSVQKTIEDVYSTHEKKLFVKLNDLERRIILIDSKTEDELNLLYALVGKNSSPRTPGALDSEEVKRYVTQVNNSIGGVVEGLPEPPVALTGRRRGAS